MPSCRALLRKDRQSRAWNTRTPRFYSERICKINTARWPSECHIALLTLNTGNFLVWAFVHSAESVHSFSQESISCSRIAGRILCTFILILPQFAYCWALITGNITYNVTCCYIPNRRHKCALKTCPVVFPAVGLICVHRVNTDIQVCP